MGVLDIVQVKSIGTSKFLRVNGYHLLVLTFLRECFEAEQPEAGESRISSLVQGVRSYTVLCKVFIQPKYAMIHSDILYASLIHLELFL